MSRRKLTQEEFIEKAKKIHANKYDYSLVDYKNTRTKIIIKCNKCGLTFITFAGQHIYGTGHCKCYFKHNKHTTESFIKLSKNIHGDKYDYSSLIFSNTSKKIKILCKTCNKFFYQLPNSHLSGHGCPNCVSKNNSDRFRSTKEKFIEKAKNIHGDKYDYSLVQYLGNKIKVKILCNTCLNYFYQKPNTHISRGGSGCPYCSKCKITSKGEKEVLKYIQTIYFGKIIENDRKLLNGKELDILIPDLNLAFEYNGEYWHNKREQESPGYHFLKEEQCRQAGIELINIWENDWKTSKKEIKHLLKTKIKKL